MLSETTVEPTLRLPSVRATVASYVALTKPRVISLLLLTTLAAMFITPAGVPALGVVLVTMLAGYLMAGGANAVNMAYDMDIDAQMGRTSRRPVPSGQLTARSAYVFGFVLAGLSFALFAILVNVLAAALAVAGFVYYTLIYTWWLKRRTVHNIVIGGGAGAVPPMIGYAAASGRLDVLAGLLFVMIFLWTPPHFWALALLKKKDYANAGVPMLPVVAGDVETIRQIWLYTWVMVAFSLAIALFGAGTWIYLPAAAVLGVVFIRYAWQLRGEPGNPRAFALYKFSLLYLALIFLAMVADRLILGRVA